MAISSNTHKIMCVYFDKMFDVCVCLFHSFQAYSSFREYFYKKPFKLMIYRVAFQANQTKRTTNLEEDTEGQKLMTTNRKI